MNKAFCPNPWIMLATRTNGDVRICCQTNQGPTKGLLLKPDGAPYNLGTDCISDTRNAKLIRQVRLAMLQERRHPECIRCWQEEDSGIKSRRIFENMTWQDVLNIKKAKEITDSKGNIPEDFEPVYYDLRLGNLCNLKCRICAPTESSSWYKDYVDLYKRDYFKDTHGTVRLIKDKKGVWSTEKDDYEWPLSNKFWQELESKIKYIKLIYLAGGEPLLIKRHYEFLEECIKQDCAKNIKLEYNTNMTKVTDRILKLWGNFEEVRIGASLDAYGKVNEYIRFPSKWQIIERSLRRLDEATGNFKIWIATTVQIYNVLYLPEFIKWKLTSQFKRINPIRAYRPFIALHPLHTPPFLNIKALPPKAKIAVKRKFQSFYPWFDNWAEKKYPHQKNRLSKEMRQLLNGYINYMNQEDLSEYLPKFWHLTRKLDEIRGQSIEKTLPELYELIKDSEKIED